MKNTEWPHFVSVLPGFHAPSTKSYMFPQWAFCILWKTFYCTSLLYPLGFLVLPPTSSPIQSIFCIPLDFCAETLSTAHFPFYCSPISCYPPAQWPFLFAWNVCLMFCWELKLLWTTISKMLSDFNICFFSQGLLFPRKTESEDGDECRWCIQEIT